MQCNKKIHWAQNPIRSVKHPLILYKINLGLFSASLLLDSNVINAKWIFSIKIKNLCPIFLFNCSWALSRLVKVEAKSGSSAASSRQNRSAKGLKVGTWCDGWLCNSIKSGATVYLSTIANRIVYIDSLWASILTSGHKAIVSSISIWKNRPPNLIMHDKSWSRSVWYQYLR